ncbi:hypothetical protein [Erythrobacter sanguineus]|nr:hypothetical protein [Erythrobacter sanguineus]
MNKIVISSTACAAVAVFAAIASLATPAPASSAASSATDLKCGCYAPVESKIAAGNPSNGYNLNCESNDRFTTTGTAVSVQKSDMKVYVDASGAVQGDNDMDITFRSRNKKDFIAAYDGNTKDLLWAGAKNDNNDQKVSGFKIEGKDGTWTAAFKGETTGTDYVGVVLFNDLGDGKKTMTALCLQDH